MIMRKPKPNDRQFGLDFGPKPSREPVSVPTPTPKEISKPTEVGAVYRNSTPEIMEDENDRDEDPRAQAAREWREARGRRRA